MIVSVEGVTRFGVSYYLLSPVLQIDRFKFTHRDRFGVECLFHEACWNYKELHGERAANDDFRRAE